MTLGAWLKKYRTEHGLSMQKMADLCGCSKAYVSVLEQEINPTTKKPVSPTIQILEKIATATGQDLDTFIKSLDGDQPITLNSKNRTLNLEETNVLNLYRELDDSNRTLVAQIIMALGKQRIA